jgi:hypothetical protein
MMEAGSTSETLVNFYQTTRRYNPEDSHLSASTDQLSDCKLLKKDPAHGVSYGPVLKTNYISEIPEPFASLRSVE